MPVIREITEADAAAFVELNQRLDEETEFMMYEPGERPGNAVEQAHRIRAISAEENKTILVAEEDGGLVGYLLAFGMSARRVRHRAHVVIGVLKSHWRRGIGTGLLAELDRWARRNSVRRLELTVTTANEAAVELYKKAGFTIEGTRKESLCIRGAVVDEYSMAKILEPIARDDEEDRLD